MQCAAARQWLCSKTPARRRPALLPRPPLTCRACSAAPATQRRQCDYVAAAPTPATATALDCCRRPHCCCRYHHPHRCRQQAAHLPNWTATQQVPSGVAVAVAALPPPPPPRPPPQLPPLPLSAAASCHPTRQVPHCHDTQHHGYAVGDHTRQCRCPVLSWARRWTESLRRRHCRL